MKYYIHVKGSKLIDWSNFKYMGDEWQNLEITEDIAHSIENFGINYYTYLDGKLTVNPDYKEEQAKKERERINMLSLTAADVERAIYKARGIDFEDILELVKNNPEIDIKALKIELKANNFYRGNPYIDTIGIMLGYSTEDLDNLFETGSLPVIEKDLNSGETEPTDTESEVNNAGTTK